MTDEMQLGATNADISGLATALQTYLAGRPPNTARAYESRLRRFVEWRATQPPAPFLAHVRAYIGHLQAEGLAPRSVQAHVNAIKGLLRTAAALEPRLSAYLPQLDQVKAPTVHGEVQGRRLNQAQRQALLDAPGTSTHKGRRDTVILALLSVLGLRRAEVCALNWGHIGELDGHKAIVNLLGKHGRVRTIKLPVALWRLLIAWGELAGLDTSPEAPVFVAIRQCDRVMHGQRLTPNGIAHIVKTYAASIAPVTPHDLRRTAASLARKGGASIEQVQVMLGHASPQTTSAYIGETLNLDDHAVDYSPVVIPEPDLSQR